MNWERNGFVRLWAENRPWSIKRNSISLFNCPTKLTNSADQLISWSPWGNSFHDFKSHFKWEIEIYMHSFVRMSHIKHPSPYSGLTQSQTNFLVLRNVCDFQRLSYTKSTQHSTWWACNCTPSKTYWCRYFWRRCRTSLSSICYITNVF